MTLELRMNLPQPEFGLACFRGDPGRYMVPVGFIIWHLSYLPLPPGWEWIAIPEEWKARIVTNG